MKITILGSRGIPANYSGLEACIEESASRLVARGHRVVVYCRAYGAQERPARYKNVELVWLPAARSKHGETLLHSALSSIHALQHHTRDTVIHFYGVGNAPFLSVFRALGFPVLISVDGQDWRRKKWGRAAKVYLRFAASAAAKLARYCIVDSQVVEDYYRRLLGATNVCYIPYGYDEPAATAGADGVLERLGVRSGHYVLFVGRIVPEKGVHYLLRAYGKLNTELPLLIVGATQDPAYQAELRSITPPNTIFAGPIYGAEAAALYRHAYMYVHPSDIDGTSHALLSAMGSGLAPLVSDIPENLETIGGAGFSFRRANVGDLAARLRQLLPQPELLAQVGAAARRRIQQHYNWDAVTDSLEQLYHNTAPNNHNTRPIRRQ